MLVVGDFGQAPPIGEPSLIGPKASPGCRLFDRFSWCVRLRRVHRQSGVCPYKESTLRLRDGAMTLADYELWRTHDVTPGNDLCSAELRERASRFTWLCAENEAAGKAASGWRPGAGGR